MAKTFQGVVNVGITESIPDWDPYAQPRAPRDSPNILYIVLDDIGFSAMEPFGGLIETPNINRIADRGLVYSNFHTTARSSPTRSCLLTGRNHTTNSMGTGVEAPAGFPNASGHLPYECGTLAEVLGERGWNTYHVGKWHLCPEDEMSLASPRRQWPLGRGFERFYGFLGAATNQWYPDLIHDNHPVEQPATPDQGYHFGTDITDRALSFIRDAKAVAPDKPFLLSYAPGACHAPHQAPKEWIDRYAGRFDMGYEAYREIVLRRQKSLGIVSEHARLPPEIDTVRPWASLGGEKKLLFARMAEAYAGFLSHADDEIGRLLDYLDDSGQLDNTMIVLVSDNGAAGEGGPNGWAWAFNTPFKVWKRFDDYAGGTAAPMIISWPRRITTTGVRTQYAHAVDIVPTIYACLGVQPLQRLKGYVQLPLEGVSFAAGFDDPEARTGKRTQFYSMGGTRAIWHDGWKAAAPNPAAPDAETGFPAARWELFDTVADPAECHDLAAERPEKLQELVALWWAEAGRYQALPLEDRNAADIRTTERPRFARPRPTARSRRC